jgi:hypothetical protein
MAASLWAERRKETFCTVAIVHPVRAGLDKTTGGKPVTSMISKSQEETEVSSHLEE